VKKLGLLLFGIFMFSNAYPQYNFHRLSIGLGAGINQPYSDVSRNKMKPAATLYADFYFTPFVIGSLEGQFGSLMGGDRVKDRHLREFKNSYNTVLFSGKLALGELLNYNRRSILNSFKGLFIGTGAGFISNKMAFVTRIKPDGHNNYIFPGKDSGINLVIPATAGIAFNLVDGWGETKYILSAGYQMNLTFGEGMDGFNDSPSIFENNYNDMYSYATLNLKYCFGRKAVFYRPYKY
jgi:hypothetical protein